MTPLPATDQGPVVLIVEDHALLAHSLATALRAVGVRATVAGTREENRLVTAVRRERTLVMLDLDLGDGLTGLQLIPALRAAGARVLVVSGSTDRLAFAAAVDAGASGWVPKSAPFEDLVQAVAAAARGESLLSPTERQVLIAELRGSGTRLREHVSALASLSPKERRVLGRVMAGLPAQEIAAESFVSIATVRTQIRAILLKLGANSQRGAVAIARAAGFTGEETRRAS